MIKILIFIVSSLVLFSTGANAEWRSDGGLITTVEFFQQKAPNNGPRIYFETSTGGRYSSKLSFFDNIEMFQMFYSTLLYLQASEKPAKKFWIEADKLTGVTW